MEIDTRFPTKLNTVSDAPEPLRSALVETFPSGEPVRLLVHAPAFTTGDEKSPATLLAVTSILLLGQLRISFAALNTSHSVTIRFETVEDECYREAIDLMLAGIDPALPGVADKDRN